MELVLFLGLVAGYCVPVAANHVLRHMSESLLKREHIGTVPQHVQCAGVPKRLRATLNSLDACLLSSADNKVFQPITIQRIRIPGNEQGFRINIRAVYPLKVP